MSRLEEIKKRVEAATEGPWKWDGKGELLGPFIAGRLVETRPIILEEGGMCSEEDEQFIAYAREDVPWLLEKLKEAIACCKKFEDENWHKDKCEYEDCFLVERHECETEDIRKFLKSLREND